MRRDSQSTSVRKSKIVWIAAGIAFVLFLFLSENLWIDERLRHVSHRIPSFIPSALSTAWFIVLVIVAIAIILLIVCLVLLLIDRNSPPWIKSAAPVTVALVMVLSMQWALVTNGQPGLRRFLPGRKHKVVLAWKASPSPVAGYNVYRRSTTGAAYERLNPFPISVLTYTDANVQSGMTYFYFARSVGAHGEESVNSNIFTITVP